MGKESILDRARSMALDVGLAGSSDPEERRARPFFSGGGSASAKSAGGAASGRSGAPQMKAWARSAAGDDRCAGVARQQPSRNAFARGVGA